MRVLHVIERLARGGASRSLLAHARYTRGVAQDVLSLLPPDRAALALARDTGVGIVPADDGDDRIAAADITHLHFWNTPELYAWLRRPLPPTRLLLTLHVAGEHPAQVATRPLLSFADMVVATCATSLELPQLRELAAARRRLVLDSADFARLGAATPRPHDGFHVGYVGTVGFAKIHPNFVDMSAAARLPAGRFRVVGTGDAVAPLTRRARDLGAGERFEWLGYVEDVGAVLASLDVFGYPLRHDTYATGELALQEAMFAGVPPVVLAHGAPARLIAHGETGLIASDAAQYTQALETLHARPAERRRLAANARSHARAALGAANTAPQLGAVYEELMTIAKRDRRWATRRFSPHPGADAFVEALGDTASAFLTSLTTADEATARAAEHSIAAASPVVTDAGAGGVLHYRSFYPQDPYLRLWSGLVLEARGRPALAAAEYHHARALGLSAARISEYGERALRRAS